MIAKMKSNSSLSGTLGYNLKEESEVIDVHNLEGDNVHDYERQMRDTQELFEGRAKNLTAHVILSPGIEDGKKLTTEQWKEIANDYLKKTGLEKRESIVFIHQDREHKHLHLVVNRIDENGKIYRNGNELAMSQRVGNEIAQERGMMQAREVMKENQRLRAQGLEPGTGGSVQNIRNDLRAAASESIGEKRGFNQEKYFAKLRERGYQVKEHLNKETGEVRGYGIEKNGTFYNASDIGKGYTLTNLKNPERLKEIQAEPKHINTQEQRQLQQQEFTLEQMRESLRIKEREKKKESELEKMKSELKELTQKKYNNTKEYFAALEKSGYQVKQHLNKETGEVRGYGIEKNGTFYNASDIGKEFTLKELNKANVILEKEQTKGQKKDRDIGREL